MILSVSCAFAAILLKLIDAESGGIHFVGESSTGKTTAGWQLLSFSEVISILNNHEDNNALKDFLLTLLQSFDGMSAKDIQKEAQDAGHSWRTIRRAKEELGIKPEKRGLKQGWVWRLPSKMSKQKDWTPSGNLDTFRSQKT